jgi:23S rRNA-/tRNA-specific pseudouridylate synthase
MYGYPPPFNAMGQSMKHVLVHVRAPWTNHSVPWQRASAVASFGRSLTISTTGYRPGIAICARHRSCPQFGFGRTLTTSHMDSVITDGGQEDESTGRTILQAGPAYPTRLDRFLAEHRPGIPFSFVQKLIRLRKVRIQNHAGAWIRESDPARRLGTGEHVCVHSRLFAEGKPPHDGTPRLPFLPTRDIQRVREAILFEDEDCIVINKPSGLAVQGGSKIPQGRHLDAWIQHVLAGDAQGRGQMRLVHRLDRETSGCLVVAKTRPAAAAFASAFKEGHVSKMYVALVAGRIPRKSGACNDTVHELTLVTLD